MAASIERGFRHFRRQTHRDGRRMVTVGGPRHDPPSTTSLVDQSPWSTPLVPAANGRCRVAGALFTLYGSQADLEARLGDLLADPPPLRRYAGAIGWEAEPVPGAGGMPRLLHIPSLMATPASPGAESAIEDALT